MVSCQKGHWDSSHTWFPAGSHPSCCSWPKLGVQLLLELSDWKPCLACKNMMKIRISDTSNSGSSTYAGSYTLCCIFIQRCLLTEGSECSADELEGALLGHMANPGEQDSDLNQLLHKVKSEIDMTMEEKHDLLMLLPNYHPWVSSTGVKLFYILIIY